MALVTILGGTGVFGGRIAKNLSGAAALSIRIAARNEALGQEIATAVGCEIRRCDVDDPASLKRAIDGAQIVIHAAGPFQGRAYRVAALCIDSGAHYLDLADARDFVVGISELNAAATRRGVLVLAGASSVPAVTSAMVRELLPQFARVDRIIIALSPGNQNPRGSSTIAAILSYLGKPIQVWQDGRWTQRLGWSDAHDRAFPPPVGRRRVYNCDVPDLALFPKRFAAGTVRFYAGVELEAINYSLSALALLRRLVGLKRLETLAPLLLRASLVLYRLGSKNGSLALWMTGDDHSGKSIERRLAIVTDDDGPATPCAAASILARRFAAAGVPATGAMPCVGLVSLSELADHLTPFGVWVAEGDENGWR